MFRANGRKMQTVQQETISAIRLASELIRRLHVLGRQTTNLDLQKLAYFAHGWHLALLGTPLVDEEFEAWRFGPVLPSVYHKFKVFSSNPVPFDYPLVLWEKPIDSNTDTSQLIDRVLAVYGKTPSFDLVNMSHAPDGPWAAAWDRSSFSSTIDNDEIRKYFVAQSQRG